MQVLITEQLYQQEADYRSGDHAHGQVDLHKALVASCDVYFYNVGKMLGIDLIHQ